ncbi:hypothetical protein I3843_11G147800 [Carya illinoinensis]|uniref:Bifunctional inhibitor/plant lipid transfer protein/seed storage helical domain-containing protein n=1 Tax=Carya illinoinensis TaxID=32201 RepID=A0A8T1P438_CARIL|nr:hypothetical protein I3760_11G148000 [Carya illinoinensis]KAG6637028.1 hypothetical protein CIPAW_11G151800 [Carya illinoinensis]KAG6688933.1 hypothetical protein I3842_11G150700 [Carya illinoinensis]KAG7956906.1 hypothetical protein I3843_11G147800 [Carya illinoinensis]
MDSRRSLSAALFMISINLIYFTHVSDGNCHTCPKPNPNPSPNPTLAKHSCPIDALKLGVCAKLLNGTVDTPCCSLLGGLLDLEVAVCLCTAIKANILGINLNVPVSLSLLVNTCGKKLPSGFKCA